MKINKKNTNKARLNKSAFSLIEVIIAASILSITVFGVYKLIGENAKILNNSDNFIKAHTLFSPLQECIKNIFSPPSPLKTDYKFNFGNDGNGCFTGSREIVELDKIEYYLSGRITNSGSTFINWKLEISNDEIGKLDKDFIQVK